MTLRAASVLRLNRDGRTELKLQARLGRQLEVGFASAGHDRPCCATDAAPIAAPEPPPAMPPITAPRPTPPPTLRAVFLPSPLLLASTYCEATS